MTPFNLRVLAPDHPYYEGECEFLVVSTNEGEYGVLAHHNNTILAIVPGEIRIKTPSGESMKAAVSYGMMRVENNDVLILVNTIENPDEIDEARARRAAEKAQEALLHQQSKKDYIQAKAKMARAMNRLKVKNNAK